MLSLSSSPPDDALKRSQFLLPLVTFQQPRRSVQPLGSTTTMRIINLGADTAEPIARFESVAASRVPLGHGSGDVHVYCVHFDANGSIGVHPTGFCQLFLVVHGSGWAVGGDGERVQLESGQGVFLERAISI